MRPIVRAVGLICILAQDDSIVKIKNVIQVSCHRSGLPSEHRFGSSPDGDRPLFVMLIIANRHFERLSSVGKRTLPSTFSDDS